MVADRKAVYTGDSGVEGPSHDANGPTHDATGTNRLAIRPLRRGRIPVLTGLMVVYPRGSLPQSFSGHPRSRKHVPAVPQPPHNSSHSSHHEPSQLHKVT